MSPRRTGTIPSREEVEKNTNRSYGLAGLAARRRRR